MLTLQDVLELPVLREVVVDGTGRISTRGRVVRWASVLTPAGLEDARPQEMILMDLAAGEVGAACLRALVGEFAGRNAAAVVLRADNAEGRLPSYAVAASSRAGLPVIAVRGSVQLSELADAVNRAIIGGDNARSKVLEHVDRQLHEALAAGGGLSGLIDLASSIIEAPLALLAPLRRVMAASGFDPDVDPRDLVADPESTQIEVEIQDGARVVLCAGPVASAKTMERDAVMSTLSPLVEIELLQSSEAMPRYERTRREFLIDLLVGTVRSSREFMLRAAFAGFSPPRDASLVGMAMPLDSAPEASVSEILDAAGIASFCAPLNQDLLLVVELSDPEAVERVSALLVTGLQCVDRASGPLLAVGPPTADHGNVGLSLNEARDTLSIARDLRMTNQVVGADSVAIERLFSRLVNDADLVEFVDNRLSDLLADEDAHTSLVPTLQALFDSGLNKAAAARALGIRRQTLHARVERIESFVGPLDDHENRVALELALRVRHLVPDRASVTTPDPLPDRPD